MVASQAFHGFCFAFFFAAGFIYVDKLADDDVRHSAQTVFGIIILAGAQSLVVGSQENCRIFIRPLGYLIIPAFGIHFLLWA